MIFAFSIHLLPPNPGHPIENSVRHIWMKIDKSMKLGIKFIELHSMNPKGNIQTGCPGEIKGESLDLGIRRSQGISDPKDISDLDDFRPSFRAKTIFSSFPFHIRQEPGSKLRGVERQEEYQTWHAFTEPLSVALFLLLYEVKDGHILPAHIGVHEYEFELPLGIILQAKCTWRCCATANSRLFMKRIKQRALAKIAPAMSNPMRSRWLNPDHRTC